MFRSVAKLPTQNFSTIFPEQKKRGVFPGLGSPSKINFRINTPITKINIR